MGAGQAANQPECYSRMLVIVGFTEWILYKSMYGPINHRYYIGVYWSGLYPSFVGYYTNWIYTYKPVSPPVAINHHQPVWAGPGALVGICSHAHALGQFGNHPTCGQPIFAPYPFLLCSATLILLFPMSIVFHCIPFRRPTQIPLPSVSMYDLANISLLTTT